MMPRIRPHTWAITGVVLLGLLFVTPSRLLAQSVVHVLFDDRSGCDPWSPQTCTVARLLSATVDGGGARITASSVVPRVANLRRLYATPDGTTLAWLGYTDATGYALYVHDLARQQTRMLPVGGTTPGEFVGNPAMPEAYLVGPTGITAYGAAGSRRFADRVCSNPREVSVSPDGRRLAKRHGDTSIRSLRAAGWSAEDLVGWLAASAGIARDGERASPRSLIPRYDPARLS